MSLNEGLIRFVNFSFLERLKKLVPCVTRPCSNHNTARIFIESINQAGVPTVLAYLSEKRMGGNKSVRQRLATTFRKLNGMQAGWFIHREDLAIIIEKSNRFHPWVIVQVKCGTSKESQKSVIFSDGNDTILR